MLCVWHVRTTGAVSWSALLALVLVLLVCIAIGRACADAVDSVVPRATGVAWELLLGFFVANTLLFLLTLASPFGFAWHAVAIAALAVAATFTKRRSTSIPVDDATSESAALACIVFTGLAATLWVGEQQPLMTMRDGLAVFTVWSDVFIHAREISAFAHSAGFASLSDIKQAGVPAPVYHYASYMVPALIAALTDTSTLDAYAAFQLPFGLLLTGLAAFVLVATLFRTTWPAVLASAVVVAAPDSYQQGFGIRYLSYHFMTQVNLGMLYGIACIAIAWVFMIEACRRERAVGVLLAYLLLATCATYKAHLFVANALLLMLYPCLFYGRFGRWQRAAGAGLAIAVFVAVATLSQGSSRVPTLRLDGSGIRSYVDILMGGFAEGTLKDGFHRLYYERHDPAVVGAALAAALVVFGSFGLWTVVAPAALWSARKRFPPHTLAFVPLVFVNYLAMSTLLALDERGIGSSEEFVNRPHAWAYFVVVVCATTLLVIAFGSDERSRRVRWMVALAMACVLLANVQRLAPRLETFPEWDGYADFREFNAAPACLVRAATFLRKHSDPSDLMQDALFDRKLIATAIAERQIYVADAAFGGRLDLVPERIATLAPVLEAGDHLALAAWARARGVTWFLLQHNDTVRWAPDFLDRAAFRCEGISVFRFER